MSTHLSYLTRLALVALLLACSKEQKTAEETSTKKPATSAEAMSISASDTAFANQCFAKAEQFAHAAKYDSAIGYFQKASIFYEAAQKWPQYVQCYNKMGDNLWRKGNYEQALQHLNRALEAGLARLGEQHANVAECYRLIGIIYMEKGDADQALGFYEKALSIQLNTFGERHPGVASTYKEIGNYYTTVGDYVQALAFFNKALAVLRATAGEQNYEVAAVYKNIGNVYAYRRDFDQALVFYKKSLSIMVAFGEQHPFVAVLYNNIGFVLNHQGCHDQAISFHKKALSVRLAIFGEKHPLVNDSYMNLGDAYKGAGNYKKALELYQQALQTTVLDFADKDIYSNPSLKNILAERELQQALERKAQALAEYYNKQSHNLRDLEAAVFTYQVISQLYDQARRGYKAEGSKLFLAEIAAYYYDRAIQTALQLYRITQADEHKNTAFMFAEKNKATVMLESLLEVEAKQFAGIPDSLLHKELQLRLDLTFYDENLTKEKLKGEAGDRAQIALWQDKVFGLKQAYESLLQRFEKDYPDYYNLKYQVKTATVEDVEQEVLDKNTALVEYFTGKDSIFIFAITNDSFAIAASARDSLFDKRVEQLRQGIFKQDFTTYVQTAHRLYQALLAPVAGQIDRKSLIIVPDGSLSAVPFEALLTEQVAEVDLKDFAKLPYLINDHAISYAYSATLLQQAQARKNRVTKRDYLAFAPVFAEGLPAGTRGTEFFKENLTSDSSQTVAVSATASASATRIRGYLPSTKKEVTGILNDFENRYGLFERWFGNKSRVYLEKEAKEENLKLAGLGDYRYVHFATHGLVNAQNPKLSGLLLAQEDSTSKEDGILHLGEIYNLNLNADLVVLSACETGLGQVAKGEGIIGLTRGFLYAGASNLLVSLWQVSDVTTADLMVDFYDKMLGGISKPEALREAKLQMIRRHAEYAKPYYWASFILVGR